MSRFGLRKRIKAVLGGSTSSATKSPPTPTHEVIFECPDGERYTAIAEEGDSLLWTSSRGEQPIDSSCTDGTCGTCRVEVVSGEGSLSEARAHEEKTKADVGVPAQQRLGCHAGVFGDGVVVRIINVLGEETIDP